jgi:hypothetical protein
MGVPDFALSVRQPDRWFAGGVATLPRPSVCRVLEAEFGYPIETLLASESQVPVATNRHQSTGHSDRALRTVEFMSWIADQSNLAFDDVYVAVAELADKLAVEPAVERAAKEHARATVSRAKIVEAVQRYYDAPTETFYGVDVAGCGALSLTMSTEAEWVGLDVVLGPGHESFRLDRSDELGPIDLSPTGLSAAIARLAAVETADTVLLDNPLYRLLDIEVGRSSISATLGLTTFAAYVPTSDLLEAELLDSLAAPEGQSGFPLRGRYLPSFASALSLRSRLCAGGPACLVAVARSDDYLLLIQERSPRVFNVAGRLLSSGTLTAWTSWATGLRLGPGRAGTGRPRGSRAGRRPRPRAWRGPSR